MTAFINKYTIHIQLGVALIALGIMITFVYKTAVFASTTAATADDARDRVSVLEIKMQNVATKNDLQEAKQDIKDNIASMKADLKDYINKH